MNGMSRIGLIVLSLVMAARSTATVLNFDSVSAPCGFSDTAAARSEFAGLGVVFSAPGNDGGAVLNQCGVFAVTGFSSPNFMAFNAGGFYLNGGVPRAPETLLFSPTVGGICFRAGSGFGPGFTLTADAFDGTDNLLASRSLVLTPALAPIGLASPGIAKLVITYAAPNGSFVIDDLEFGSGADADTDGVFDQCDNCPMMGNTSQDDADADGDGDACDPCPHTAGVAPGVLTAKLALLSYGGDGPGNSNDKPKIVRGTFSSALAFDPASTDDVHVTIADAGTGAVLFGADLTAASGLWRRPNPATRRWTYRDPDPTTAPGASGVASASLLEKPAGSGNLVFKLRGKSASIDAGYSGAGMTVRLEIGPTGGGVCVGETLGTCTSVSMRSDRCRNP